MGDEQHDLDAAFRMNVEAFFDAHPHIHREFLFFQFKRVAEWLGDAGVDVQSMHIEESRSPNDNGPAPVHREPSATPAPPPPPKNMTINEASQRPR